MLSVDDKAQLLEEVPFFAGVTPEQIQVVATVAEELTCPAGHIIVREGEPSRAMYVIVSGRVAIEKQNGLRPDSAARLATLGPKQSFAEGAIFDDEPCPSGALALEPTTLLIVRDEPIRKLVQEQPALALGMLHALSHRIIEWHNELVQRASPKPRKLLDLYDKL